MAELPPEPTLPHLQRYMADVCRERGWDSSSVLETFLLFTEEVGELAKAIRNHQGLFLEEGRNARDRELEGELADVLSYLLDLANRLDVDLEQAFRDKEAVNASRKWA